MMHYSLFDSPNFVVVVVVAAAAAASELQVVGRLPFVVGWPFGKILHQWVEAVSRSHQQSLDSAVRRPLAAERLPQGLVAYQASMPHSMVPLLGGIVVLQQPRRMYPVHELG